MPTIARLDTFRVDYPVAGRFKFFEQPGRTPCRPTVVLKLTADDGSIGWGQAVPSPRWSYETVHTVEQTLRIELAEAILGLPVDDLAAVHAAMDRAVAPSFSTGQPIAKAAIDLALVDLLGRSRGQSVAKLWNRSSSQRIDVSWTLNPVQLADVEPEVERALALGYRSFNLKVAPDVAYDLELCRLVRSLAPDAFLWVDANGGYDESSALEAAPQFAALGMAALEQPLPANCLTGFRSLKRQAALPILMDKPILSRRDLEQFLAFNLLDGVAMKVSRCGGFYEALRILELVEREGLYWLGSGLTDPDLSLAATLALYAAFQLDKPAALNGPQYLTTSILRNPIACTNGSLAVPSGPGLGVEVDETALTTDAA